LIVIPQLLLLAGFVILLQRRVVVSPVLTLVAFCMCPLLMIHAVASYNDLLAGLLIACGLVLIVEILAEDKDVPTRSWLLLGCLFAAASMTKFQSTLVASVVMVFLAIALILQRRITWHHFLWILAIIVAINAWEIRNLLLHDNPFYPITVELAGRTLFAGPEQNYVVRPEYGPHIGPFYFLTSITEFDWIKRGVVPAYSLEMGAGDISRAFGQGRTGGFGQAYIIATGACLIVQILGWRRIDRVQRTLFCLSIVLLVATSFMPQSHELRYWIYLPLILNVATIRFISMCGVSIAGALLMLSPFVAIAVASSGGYVWDSRYISAVAAHPYVNRDSVTKEVNYTAYIDFRNSRAITGQNTSLICRRDFQVK
jgi:hypothetical protein